MRTSEIPEGDRGADQPRKFLEETEVQNTPRKPLKKQLRRSLEDTAVLCHCASGGHAQGGSTVSRGGVRLRGAGVPPLLCRTIQSFSRSHCHSWTSLLSREAPRRQPLASRGFPVCFPSGQRCWIRSPKVKNQEGRTGCTCFAGASRTSRRSRGSWRRSTSSCAPPRSRRTCLRL